MGNAVRITRNHIYGNMTGISSDTLSAAGHPGFPADSSEIDHNYIYANNLDLYTDRRPCPRWWQCRSAPGSSTRA